MGWNLKSPRNEKINPSPKPHFSALVFGGASKLRGLVSIPPERPHFPMWMAWRTGRCACWMDIGRMVQRWRGWRWWLGQGRVMGVDLDWLGGASKWKGWLIFVKGIEILQYLFLRSSAITPELGNPVFYQPGFYGLVAWSKHWVIFTPEAAILNFSFESRLDPTSSKHIM